MPSWFPLPHHSTWAIAALYTLLANVRNDNRSPDIFGVSVCASLCAPVSVPVCASLCAPVSVCASLSRHLLLEGDSRQQLLSPAWRSCWRRWRRGLKQVAAAAGPFLSGALCLHCLGGQTLLCFKCFIVQVKLSLVRVPQRFLNKL